MIPPNDQRVRRYAVPAVAIVIGVVYLVASAIAGDARTGILMLVIMIAFAAILVAAGRSDIVQMLRGQPADERYQHILTQATVIAGHVVAVFTVAMCVIELSSNGNPTPYMLVAAVFGMTFISAVAWLRFRT